MNRHKIFFVLLSLLSYCACEISYEKKNKLLNGFIDLFNSLPNQIYTCDEGYLRNAQQSTEQNSYEIEVTLKVSEQHNLDSTKYLRCTGKIVDLEEVGVSVLNHHCEETTLDDKDKEIEETTATETISDAAEATLIRKPIQLDNEVQTDTTITSGEQFIAIPREEQKVHCIGCASHVNPDAPGVSELATLGVRQLDILEPNIHHTLNSVVDVERQVQVVNGIRYTLTLVIDYNSCIAPETETCLDSKTCKISVLEKPWMKLLDGSKYRAILSNNCTEEWQFGDNGVVIDKTPTDNRENNNISSPLTDGSDIIKPIINVDVQSQPHTEKTLTDVDIKDIQQQIIPYNKFDDNGNEATLTAPSETTKSAEQEENKEHVVKLESASHSSPNAIPVINPVKIENLSEDKKKAIDDMMNFFEFAGLNSGRPDVDSTRRKRSYDRDLNMMNLVEQFQKVKKHVENAKYVYELAQIVVDYLNEMDSEVKNRALKDVINAEDETDNHRYFYYIQSRVIIPCDNPECEKINTVPKICNAALDVTNKKVIVLNVFCYDELKKKLFGKVNSVALNDPVLLNLVKEATNKIESESTHGKAMKVNRIIDASTLRVSGTLTKFSIMLDHTNCDKTVSSARRSSCLIQEELGSEICEVTVYEKYQPKDRTITYTCTERPVGTSFSNIQNLGLKKSVNDLTVLNMVDEALQNLNKQSNMNSKQIAIKINSVTTQLVAGFLTDIEFVVGYTACKNDVEPDISECKLLENEPLRTCKVKVWDRTWLEDGKQLDVSCKESNIENNELAKKQKRHLNFVGGPIIEDVNSPKIKDLTKEALRKHLLKSGYHRHFEIIDILQATVQVVAGSLTNIKFKISPTTCLIDKEGNPPSDSDCKIYDSNDVTTCTALIWEKEWLEFKQINTTCEIDNDNIKVERGIPGSASEQNPNDPEYRQLAQESMQKYLQNSGNTIPHKILSIEKVTTQVVAGTKTVIHFKISTATQATGDVISCVSDIWEQPWRNFKEIKVDCSIDNHSKVKRQITGGETEHNPNDPEYRQLAQESMQKYLQNSGNTIPHKVLSIEKVTTQVVAGTKTVIHFKISPATQATGDVISCVSDIWEQPWRNFKEIKVDCSIDNHSKVKRQITGGETEQNPNDPEYRQLAQESMQKYLQNSGNTIPHKVLTIEKVTTQVVAGTKTVIHFKISPVSQETGDVISCMSDIWEKPWKHFKEINVNCNIDDHPINRKQFTLVPMNPNFEKLTEESMQLYLNRSSNTTPHKVVKIEKVVSRIQVGGIETTINFKIAPANQINGETINCVSVIKEKPAEKLKDIHVNCSIGSRAKRHSLVGNISEQDPKKHEFRKLAEESMKKYLKRHGKTNPYKIVTIDRVMTQYVSGIITIINFKITKKSNEPADILNCQSKISEQVWINNKNIKVNCKVDKQPIPQEPLNSSSSKEDNHSKVKRQIPGGKKEQNPNDPEYRQLAQESMQKYLQNSGNTIPHKILSIEKVTTQVVAGTKTVIHFKICPASQATGDVISCVSDIWEQAWRNFKEIKVDCSIDNHSKVKRQITGGETEQNPNDPEYRQLAQESMQKYLQNSGNTIPHKVLRIEKVTTQVVAGTKTVIHFKISPATQATGDVISCVSDIWEQPWRNFKEIKVDCSIDNHSKVKRQITGGETEQNPNDPEYRQLAQESMQKYLQNSGNTIPHKVLRIEKVTTQVVAGTKTVIHFKISPATQATGDVISCVSDIWEQPWRNFKEIKVDCSIDNHSKVKRQITGGETEQNPNDPEYRQLAQESMQKYLQNSGNTIPHKVLRIEKVTTQVVAGTKTVIHFKISPATQATGDVISCVSDIWEQPWRNFKEIKVDCSIDNHSKVKRQITGGETEQNPNDPEYRQLAQESMQKYLQNSGNTIPHKVLRIEKVTTQVVAGTKTVIHFKISPAIQATGDVISCVSDIWEQPWRNFKEIKVDCSIDNHSKVKRQITGGETEQNPNDPEYRQLAQESMQKYLQNSGNTIPHKVLRIEKVTTQVVAGTKTVIHFKISPATQATGDVISCVSDIWEQPWRNFKEIKVDCSIDNHSKVKRQITGGETEQNPNDPEYKQLAQESMQKYLQNSGNTIPHKVLSIEKVTTQVVAGTKTVIHFKISPATQTTGDVISCVSDIWEQPWRNFKEIKVDCNINTHSRSKRENHPQFSLGGQVEETVYYQNREKRQTGGTEDDYVDEDISFYYADRAIKQLNDQTYSNNLHKLVTIHGSQKSMHMDQPIVRMYIETAETYCQRHRDENILPECDELEGMNHQLCLVRIWPSLEDERTVKVVSLVCEDDEKFESISGLSIPTLLEVSIQEAEKSPKIKYKLVLQGEPQIIPTLDSSFPITINFVVATTNCTKNLKEDIFSHNCFIDISRPSRACQSRVWLMPKSMKIRKISSECGNNAPRKKRTVSLNLSNSTTDELLIQNLVQESLHKLEMSSSNRYKQKVLQIKGYSSKITSGKLTTIDFDVAYTSCLKFEWVDDMKSCEILKHLPKRHCVSQIWERLWIENGRSIDVTCTNDETPLEPEIRTESAMRLANEALKHIEAKYPHPLKQTIVRIFSLEKQVVAGIHYRMKLEVGSTQCPALSGATDCKLKKDADNKFCRVNVWLRPWTDHASNFRVTCDYQEAGTADLYHHLQAEQLFHNFLTTYMPEYIDKPDEIKRKFEIFKANIQKINELNTHEKGTATYGITRFADLSYEEFTQRFLGLKPSLRDTNQVPMRQARIPHLNIPDKFDWRDHGAVTEVKNQGSCGSCWAFSVTGNIEGQWKMQSGQLVSLSEQELVDCDKLDQGCNGGLPDNAYRAIEELGGLELEKDYPYEGDDDKCSFNKTMSKVKISGAVNITSNETGMAKWLVKNGPISIGINANAMQFYMGGVSHPWKMLCNPTNLDHGVLIVGYGTKEYPLFNKKLPYWTIKNSWGPEWGEKGYYRVFRGDGTCGVNQMASSAVI